MNLGRPFVLRLILSLVLIFLLLSQVLLVSEGWVGPLCVKTLTGPSEGDHPQYSWKKYGFPLSFLTISSEGCFEERLTRTEIDALSLAIDCAIIFLMLVGVIYQWRSPSRSDVTA
jgi:hypothetical protein